MKLYKNWILLMLNSCQWQKNLKEWRRNAKKILSIQCCKLIVSKKSCSFWDISNVDITNHAMFAQQKLLPINPLQPGVAFL